MLVLPGKAVFPPEIVEVGDGELDAQGFSGIY